MGSTRRADEARSSERVHGHPLWVDASGGAADDKGGGEGPDEGEEDGGADVLEEGARVHVEARLEDDRRQQPARAGGRARSGRGRAGARKAGGRDVFADEARGATAATTLIPAAIAVLRDPEPLSTATAPAPRHPHRPRPPPPPPTPRGLLPSGQLRPKRHWRSRPERLIRSDGRWAASAPGVPRKADRRIWSSRGGSSRLSGRARS